MVVLGRREHERERLVDWRLCLEPSQPSPQYRSRRVRARAQLSVYLLPEVYHGRENPIFDSTQGGRLR